MNFIQVGFPNLHVGNYRDTSPADRKYNCIAWAVGIDHQWWDPFEPEDPDVEYYWPETAPRDYKIDSLIVAYKSDGFICCPDGSIEVGMETIAIYVDGNEYMHAARQLANGKWTSKIGRKEDIERDTLMDLAGPSFGQVAVFMKRPRPTP